MTKTELERDYPELCFEIAQSGFEKERLKAAKFLELITHPRFKDIPGIIQIVGEAYEKDEDPEQVRSYLAEKALNEISKVKMQG